MKFLFVVFGFMMMSATAAMADEIDSCTTFVDQPPGINDHLLCVGEARHSREMGLPASPDQTVLSLIELYEIGWSLHSMQRFEDDNNTYLYRVYIVREN